MATIQGTYVRTGLSTNTRINAIVDILLSPHMAEFRQLMIYHERGTRVGNNVWRLTYQNWNPDFPEQVYLNSGPEALATSGYTVDSNLGTVTITGTFTAGDNVTVTYNFDYFPIYVMEGFIFRSVDTINAGGVGPPTSYTVDDAPTAWDAVIADLTLAMCMEKLIIDYDLWKGRLIFAIGPEELLSGGGDIVSALETIKQNAESRAGRALDNEKLKSAPYLSPPTQNYYDALVIGGSSRTGRHGGTSHGKLRGWRQNKYLGGSI